MLSLNLIVRAVVVHQGKYLVSLLDDDERKPFYTFLGGHIHIGETLLDATRREVREEIGLAINPVKLLYVVENFFFRGSNKLHEIGYYFLCQPTDTNISNLLDTLTPSTDEQIRPHLLSPQELADDDFQPAILKQALVEDARENFAGCPRAVVCNELPGDVDTLSGIYAL